MWIGASPLLKLLTHGHSGNRQADQESEMICRVSRLLIWMEEPHHRGIQALHSCDLVV